MGFNYLEQMKHIPTLKEYSKKLPSQKNIRTQFSPTIKHFCQCLLYSVKTLERISFLCAKVRKPAFIKIVKVANRCKREEKGIHSIKSSTNP